MTITQNDTKVDRWEGGVLIVLRVAFVFPVPQGPVKIYLFLVAQSKYAGLRESTEADFRQVSERVPLEHKVSDVNPPDMRELLPVLVDVVVE